MSSPRFSTLGQLGEGPQTLHDMLRAAAAPKRRPAGRLAILVGAQVLALGAAYAFWVVREADPEDRAAVTRCVGSSVGVDMAIDRATRDGRLTAKEARDIKRLC